MQLLRQKVLDHFEPQRVIDSQMRRERAQHHRVERLRILELLRRHVGSGDQHPARPKLILVDFDLRRLHHDEIVALSFRNHRAGDFFAVAHFAGNRAAALAHAVHFALFDVESGAEEHLRENIRNRQNSLSAETGDGDVGGLFHLISSPRMT